MLPSWIPFPPAWLMVTAFAIAAATMALRWYMAVGVGGRLHVFLIPPLFWLAYVYLLAELRVGDFNNPAVLALAVRFCLLLIAVLLSAINAVVAYDELAMRRRLRSLQIAL